MVCSQCQRSGYGFAKIGGKTWCGGCEGPGTRSIGAASHGPMGNTYVRGAGSLAALPSFATLTEWQEVATLCRKVSGRKLLMEDGGPITAIPLPTAKNPLDETPNAKRSGWQPLTEYYKELDKPKTKSSKNLFEG